MPVFLSVDISIFFNNLAHFLEEVVKSHPRQIFSSCFDDFLGIGTRGAVDRTIHAGGAAKEGLSHSLGHGELSLHDLFQEDHFSTGIREGPFGQVEDRANRPAEATAGALSDRLASFFIELQLSSHRIT
jgi:hypothetical protein